jgi:hypothetical protein
MDYYRFRSMVIKEIYGVVLRLDPELKGVLTFTVQDDLTGLLQHCIVATGQITLGE